MRTDGLQSIQIVNPLQFRNQFRFVPRHYNGREAAELFRSSNLVIVACLPQARAPRHDEDRFSELECRDDGARAGVGDNHPGCFKLVLEFRWIHEPCPLDTQWVVIGRTDLRKDIAAAPGAFPPIDRFHQPVEWHLSSDRYEDHNTVPR